MMACVGDSGDGVEMQAVVRAAPALFLVVVTPASLFYFCRSPSVATTKGDVATDSPGSGDEGGCR